MDMRHMPTDTDMMFGPMGWWFLTWLLLLALLIVGITFLVRYLTHGTGWARPSSSAMHILEERFARGEIDRDEFEERKRSLQS